MRILHVIFTLSSGGAERFVTDLTIKKRIIKEMMMNKGI